MKFSFEVRRGGREGNSVYLIEPIAEQAAVLKFEVPSAADNEASQRHPIWILDRIQTMQAKGMLKKDIATALKFSAPMVTYHLELAALPSLVTKRLKKLPAIILKEVHLNFLRKLAAMPAADQDAAFVERVRFVAEAARKPKSA